MLSVSRIAWHNEHTVHLAVGLCGLADRGGVMT